MRSYEIELPPIFSIVMNRLSSNHRLGTDAFRVQPER